MASVCDGLFSVGDRAVYPAHGLAEVVAIESREIAGMSRCFYILKVISSEMKLMIPVDGAERTGLRSVVTTEVAAEVFAILQAQDVAVKPGPWNRRFREYTELVNSGRLTEVAKVYRDLWRMRPGRELSFGERRLLEQSRALLVAELALVRACEESSIEAAIEGAAGTAGRTPPPAGVPD